MVSALASVAYALALPERNPCPRSFSPYCERMGRGASAIKLASASTRAQSASVAGEPAPTGCIYRKLTLDQRHSRYADVVRLLREGSLNLNPSYQRDHVWDAERQRNLIKSLMLGLPTGAIYLNERDIMEPFVVVDGKQRISAVRAWMDGELEVPAEWFPAKMLEEDHPENVTFNDLNISGQRGWNGQASVAMYYSKFQGSTAEDQERELFELINYGGVPQGQSDFS